MIWNHLSQYKIHPFFGMGHTVWPITVWAVKVSKIQTFKFYDEIVKAVFMIICVANKTLATRSK